MRKCMVYNPLSLIQLILKLLVQKTWFLVFWLFQFLAELSLAILNLILQAMYDVKCWSVICSLIIPQIFQSKIKTLNPKFQTFRLFIITEKITQHTQYTNSKKMFRFIVPFHFVQCNKNFSKSRKSKICKQVKWKACPLSILKLSSVSRKISINKPLSTRPVSWYHCDSSSKAGIYEPPGPNEPSFPSLQLVLKIQSINLNPKFIKSINSEIMAIGQTDFLSRWC